MSSTRKSLKPPPPPPPRPSGRFEDIKAAKETYSDLTYQIRRLNELYNQLTPQNGNRRASSSSSRDHQDGAQRDPKALQQLRELKANLRKDYGHPRDIPRLERLKVVVMFDDHKKPFFDIRLRPFSGYPRGYPFLIDDSEGTIAGLSVAIYQKVLKAVQEETEEEGEQFRGFGEGNHNHNNDRHAAEDLLEPVNIKQENVDEEEELITLEDDDSEDEPFNNELQQEENYNSQVVIPPPAATDNSAAIVMPENGPAALANPQANIDVAPSQLPQLPPPQPLPHNNNNNNNNNNNSINNNTAEQQRQQSAVSGSTVSQGQSSEAPSIKLEPADSSIVNIGRVSHPPSNQAPQTGHNEAPASSVAVPPPPAAAAAGASPAAAKESSSSNIRVLRMNPPSTSNTNVGPPKSKPQPPQQQQQQQQLSPPHNNNSSNNITKTSAQQLQQQPPAADVSAAAAAAADERRTLTMTPTANSSIFHIVGNNKRPAEHSNAAQPAQPAQDNPKRPKVAAAAAGTPSSSSTSTSTQASKATLRAIADRFLASAAFLKAADTAQLPCPICEKKYAKAAVKDHMDMLHILRFQYVPYHCTFAGCTYFNVWELNALSHVKQVHGCRSNPEQYLVKRAAGAAGAAGAVVPRTPGASGSAAAAAAAKRVTTTTTTPTTAATTSTPPTTASTTHQQHRPSSTSTPTTAAAAAAIAFSAVTAANVEEYLRASCPDYVAARGPCTKVKCPRCSSTPERRLLKDHVLSLHRRLKPYHCRWEGCSYATGWQSSATRHLKEVHKSSRQAEFIVFQEEEE